MCGAPWEIDSAGGVSVRRGTRTADQRRRRSGDRASSVARGVGGGAKQGQGQFPAAVKPRRRHPCASPEKLEVGDDWVGSFANSEKFRGLNVN